MLSPPSGALMYGTRLVPRHAALSASSLTALPPAFSLQLSQLRFVMLYPLALDTAFIHSYGSVFMKSPVRRHGSPHRRALLELAHLSTPFDAFYSRVLYVSPLSKDNVGPPAISSRRCFSLHPHSDCRPQRTRRFLGRARRHPGQCPSREVPISRAGPRPLREVRTLQVLVQNYREYPPIIGLHL